MKSRLSALAVRCLVPITVLACLVSGCHPASTGTPHPVPSSGQTAQPAVATNVRFVDVAGQAGLNYQWQIASKKPYNLLDTIGEGCAFLDYNNDGNLDILLVGSTLALYQGDGHGHFKDVTAAAGLSGFHGHYLGCAVGDFDGDGYEDIYITAYRGGLLLHNEHGVRFTDVTKKMGIKPQAWGTSAAFLDLYGDGRLDLYIGQYVDFGPTTVPQLCPGGDNHVMGVCGPTSYLPLKGVLYHNTGPNGFKDVTRQWNANTCSGNDLGVAFADFDGSGRESLAIANDELPGNLFKSDGHRFTDIGTSSGTAFDVMGHVVGGMGIDFGDYDNDGKLDLFVATFQNQPKCIYHNDGNDTFTERSAYLGIGPSTRDNVAFGAKWIDVDNDGWLDLVLSNGHVQDNIAEVDKSRSYRQSTQVFHNEHGTKFTDISAAALTGDAGRPIVGRGLAIGDFDNDGKEDVLVVDIEGHPLLLHNETTNAGHWLEINLNGTKSNRDGQGALITVTTDSGQKLLRQCTTSGSFMSASDKRVHFGLGSSTKASSIKIHWPDGTVQTYNDVAADRILNIREGDSHKSL